jgi:hypothetical protein
MLTYGFSARFAHDITDEKDPHAVSRIQGVRRRESETFPLLIRVLSVYCRYFAYSTYLLSRTTVTLIWPG